MQTVITSKEQFIAAHVYGTARARIVGVEGAVGTSPWMRLSKALDIQEMFRNFGLKYDGMEMEVKGDPSGTTVYFVPSVKQSWPWLEEAMVDGRWETAVARLEESEKTIPEMETQKETESERFDRMSLLRENEG